MRFPIVTRGWHERETARLNQAISAEYSRAMTEGKRLVHAWARELNFNLFQLDDFRLKGAIRQALQDAEKMFNPGISSVITEDDLKPIKRLPRPVAGATWRKDMPRHFSQEGE